MGNLICHPLNINNTVKFLYALIWIISTVRRRIFLLFEVSVIFFFPLFKENELQWAKWNSIFWRNNFQYNSSLIVSNSSSAFFLFNKWEFCYQIVGKHHLFFLKYCSCKEQQGICNHSLKKYKSDNQVTLITNKMQSAKAGSFEGVGFCPGIAFPTRSSLDIGLRIWICSCVTVANGSWICSIALEINVFGSMSHACPIHEAY